MSNNAIVSMGLLALTGCASVVIPPAHLESDQATMRAAEELGASAVPDAKLHLQLAADQSASAKKMAADGDDRANVMLSRADADADLALAMARAATVHAQAVAAAADLKAVKERGSPSDRP